MLEVETEASRLFHILSRELQMSGFSVEIVGEGLLQAKRTIELGGQRLFLVLRCSSAEGVGQRLELDIYDSPGMHAPESLCDTVADWIARIVSKALGVKVWITRHGTLMHDNRGEIRVRRVPCG